MCELVSNIEELMKGFCSGRNCFGERRGYGERHEALQCLIHERLQAFLKTNIQKKIILHNINGSFSK